MTRQLVRDFGTCLKFNGNGDNISIPALAAINSDTFSISFYINPAENRIQGLFSKGDGALTWRLFMSEADGRIEFDARNDADNLQTVQSLVPNKWYHIVITYHKPTTTARIYINGALDTYTESFANAGNDNNDALTVSPSVTARFKGMMDEILFFNGCITPTEVADLFFLGKIPSGIVAKYLLDETSGVTAIDAISANNGVITGAAYSTNVKIKPRTTV